MRNRSKERVYTPRKWRGPLQDVLTTVLSFVLLIAVWEAVILIFSLHSYTLPTPWSVARTLVNLDSYLARQAWSTLKEVLAGFALAVAVGVPLAVAISFSRIVGRLVYPLLVTSQAVPIVAIAPLLLAWFGFGYLPKVLVAAIIAVFPIVINTVAGLRGIDPDLLQMAQSMNARWHRVFWKVRVPAALPNFFGGLKLAITLSVIGAVVGEFVSGTSGLGYVIQTAQGNLQMSLAFAALVILAVMGVLLFNLVDVVERRVIPWHESQNAFQRSTKGRPR